MWPKRWHRASVRPPLAGAAVTGAAGVVLVRRVELRADAISPDEMRTCAPRHLVMRAARGGLSLVSVLFEHDLGSSPTTCAKDAVIIYSAAAALATDGNGRVGAHPRPRLQRDDPRIGRRFGIGRVPRMHLLRIRPRPFVCIASGNALAA